MALLSVLTPFVGRRQDDYQIYRSAWKHLGEAAACVEIMLHRIRLLICLLRVLRRWLYVGFAYGDQSRELAQALWRDREFEPLDRFSANSAGQQSYEAYMSCLLRWGYIHWNPQARKGQKLQWAPVEEHRASPLSQQAVERLFHGTQQGQ
jgi:hypothetical protein